MVSCLCGNKKVDNTEKTQYEGFRGPSAGGGDEATIRKVFLSRPLEPEAMQRLKLNFNVDCWTADAPMPRDQLIYRVPGSSVIFCTTSDIIDMEVLDAAGLQLLLVCNMAADASNIDLQACRRRSISVQTAAEECAEATAELTCALLLMTARRLMEGQLAVLSENWDLPTCGVGLTNGVLGILGLGRVGWGVASRLQQFGLSRVIYFDKEIHPLSEDIGAEKVSIEEVFSQSDFIVCCLALNSETRRIVNAEKLILCKPECVFINTSRSAVVVQDDLVSALEKQQLAGVGLDVTEPEPLPVNHPLLNMTNCVVTPHMGSATTTTSLKVAMSLVNSAISMCK